MDIKMDPSQVSGQGYVTRGGYVVQSDGSLGAYVGRAEVAQVPEPGTFALMGVSLLIGLLIREAAKR